MIQRLTIIALWVTLIGFCPALAQAEGTVASTPGKSVIVGPATTGPNATTLAGDVVQPSVPAQLYVEGPNPDRFYPAFLSPEGAKQAKAHALYAEALRAELRQGFVNALPLYIAITKLDPHFIQAHLKIALYYFQQNQVDKALAYLKCGLTNNPDSPELKAATAYAYRLLKRNDEALALAREVLATSPDQVTAYRVIFEIYSEQGKFDEAMKMVETTVKQNTGKAAFWVNLAKLYQDLLDEEQRQSPLGSASGRDYAKKVARQLLPIYEKALACGEPTTELLMSLSDSHEALGENDKAIDYALQAHENSPYNIEILLRLANLQFNEGHREEALKYYEDAYNLAPDYGSGWLGNTLAKIYTGMGQPQKAIDTLEQMISRTPTQVSLYNDLAELYERAEHPDKAEFNYQQALLLDSRTPTPYLHLALIQIREKKYAQADQTLADGQAKFPLSAGISWVQALSYREQKKYDASLASYAQVKTLATDSEANLISETYYIEVSMVQELAGKKELIEPTLREGLKKYPESANLLNTLAYFWAEQGVNLDEALTMSKKSLELAPTNGAFLDTLGWIYYRLDQPKEALPQLEQAISQTKEDPVVCGHLADVYAKLGRMSDAIALWQKIVQVDPDNKDAKSKLEAAKAEASNIKLRAFKKP